MFGSRKSVLQSERLARLHRVHIVVVLAALVPFAWRGTECPRKADWALPCPDR